MPDEEKRTRSQAIVTREKIFSLCEQIAACGERPTTPKLQGKLGGKGSRETINRYRALWDEEFGRQRYVAPPGIPPKLRDLVEESMTAAWALAFEDISAQYNHRIEQIENERDDLAARLSVIDDLEEKVERYAMRIGALEHENNRLEAENATLKKQHPSPEDHMQTRAARPFLPSKLTVKPAVPE